MAHLSELERVREPNRGGEVIMESIKIGLGKVNPMWGKSYVNQRHEVVQMDEGWNLQGALGGKRGFVWTPCPFGWRYTAYHRGAPRGKGPILGPRGNASNVVGPPKRSPPKGGHTKEEWANRGGTKGEMRGKTAGDFSKTRGKK